MLTREGSPYWYVRGTVHRQRVYASTKETEKAGARRFKEALEIRLARSSGECDALTFREAAALYVEFRRPQRTNLIDRLCAIIGDRLLAKIRSAALVDAASALYPGCTAATWNRHVFTPAAAILHHARQTTFAPMSASRR